MKGYGAFLQKELMEQLRTYKTFILLAVFLLFGMTSPLLAKLMPQIFASMPMDGVVLQIPDPTYGDAYGQFFKNIVQMGMIVLLLIFSGSLSQELTRGTLTIMLSRGLSRQAVILSKFTAGLFLWTVSLALSAAVNFGYTVYLFGNHPVPGLLFSCLCLWLFGAFVLALLLLSGALAPGSYGPLLLTAALLGLMLLVGIVPRIEAWLPTALASQNAALVTGAAEKSDMTRPLWVTGAALIGCLAAAIAVLNKKKI